jgi:hypothetical protein
MLRYMISSHPNVYIPPESNFIARLFADRSQEPLERADAVLAIRQILEYKVFFRDWKGELPDPESFVASLDDLMPATIIGRLFGDYAAQHGSRRWGDKSPIYTDHITEISSIMPEALFIHVIRDGRDVALSMMKSYQGPRFFYIDLCYAARSWRRRVIAARRAGETLGSQRYMEVRYEDLTKDPGHELLEIANFIGEDFAVEMTRPEETASTMYHSRGIHSSTRSAPSDKSSHRWKGAMTESDERIFRALAGDVLDELGYDVDGPARLGFGERGRLGLLLSKYALVEGSRRLLRATGVAHPARLLTKR